MNNCLVTKLKATVNNPNLPILKTDISDFTKAAILASGNDSMTETQKWALDSFFESIGAITNSVLWQKIKILYIPTIAGEVAKAFVNYADLDAVPYTSASVVLDDNAVFGTGTTSVPTSEGVVMNSANFGYYASMNHDISITGRNLFEIDDVSNSSLVAKLNTEVGTGVFRVCYFDANTTKALVCSTPSEGLTAVGTDFTLNVINTDASNSSFRMVNSSGQEIDFSVSTPGGTLVDSPISSIFKVGLVKVANINAGYRIILAGQAFSDAESEIIINAGRALEAAFVVSQ
jgi:hypothetical protein